MADADILKLQNGSDIRGVALDGVEGENVNLTADICSRIGSAFAVFLSKKLGKPLSAAMPAFLAQSCRKLFVSE